MALLLGLAGLALGCFINYLADVLPFTRSLSAPICTFCGGERGWPHYLAGYRCPSCGKGRPNRVWIVPLFFAFLMPYFWYFPLKHLTFGWAVLLLAFFTLVAITDLEYRAILNQVSLVGVGIGLAVGFSRHTWWATLLGGAAGFGIMLFLYYVGSLFGRYLARRRGVEMEDEDALGFGDVNLSGIIGLILGWPGITAGLVLGIVLGGLVGGMMILTAWIARRYKPGVFIPYAPFLVLGAVILLYLPW